MRDGRANLGESEYAYIWSGVRVMNTVTEQRQIKLSSTDNIYYGFNVVLSFFCFVFLSAKPETSETKAEASG